jgi:hypothetical protein
MYWRNPAERKVAGFVEKKDNEAAMKEWIKTGR